MSFLVVILNLLAIIILLSAIVLLFRYQKSKESFRLWSVFLILSFSLLILANFTNFLEHAGISVIFDSIEDTLELLITPFLVFAIYAFLIQSELLKRKEAESFLKKIIHTAPVSTYIYNIETREIRYLKQNPPFQNYNNHQSDNNSANINFLQFLEKCDKSRLEKFRAEIIENPHNTDKVYRFECQIAISDSDVRYIEIYENVFSNSAAGKPKEMVGIVVDATDRIKAQNELEEYKTHLEQIIEDRTKELESVVEEMAVINEQLTIANENLTSSNNELKVLNEINEKQSQKIEKLNNELNRKNEILEYINKDLSDKKEKLEESLESLHRMQEKLIQQEKLSSLGTLIAGIAHEIINPVNYINSGVGALRKHINDINDFVFRLQQIVNEDDVSELLAKLQELKSDFILENKTAKFLTITANIEIGVERIIELLNSLKNYTSNQNETFKTVNLHAIIESVLTMLKHEYSQRIKIVKEFSDIPEIWCMPGKINQVLCNLILNAIQAISYEGTITIKTTFLPKKNYVLIAISDSGQGIPKEIQNKIFDPFFTTKDVGKGTGLGLSISYEIIKNHQGKISFNSSKITGTEFLIELPAFNSN